MQIFKEKIMKILNRIAKIIVIILALSIVSIVVLYVSVRHKLDFEPENKPADKIVIYGDTRSQHLVHNKVVTMIRKENPDMVLFTGDMVSNGRNIIHWLIYSTIENGLWSNAEYYPTRGNHEKSLLYYKTFLDLPNGNTYYSFDRDDIHFIVLDVIDAYSPIDPTQLEWLKKDLNDNKGKPKIVSMHLPMYTSGKYLPYNAPELHELFKNNGVLFVFSAHNHSYERSLVDGVNYIVTAGGGAPLYPATHSNPHKVIRIKDYNYTVLTRDNDTFNLIAKGFDGKEIDNVTVKTER